MPKHFVFLLIAGVLSTGSPLQAGAEDGPLPLFDAVKAAVDRGPSLGAAREALEEARAARREVNSLRWPRLSARGQFTRGDDPVYVFGSLLRQQSFGPQNFAVPSLNNPGYHSNFAGALEIGVPIFTGFEWTDAGETARLHEDLARAQAAGLAQRVRYDALETALRAMLSREHLSALDARLESARKELASARRLKDKGLVLGSDYFAAEAIAGGLEAWRAQTKRQLDAAAARLSVLTGLSVGTSAVSGTLSERAYEAGALEEWTALAAAERADLRLAKIQESLAETGRRREGRTFLPKVDAFAQVETNTEDFHRNPSDRIAGLRASVALGDPGYGPRRRRARHREEASRHQSRAAEENARGEIIQAWTGYRAAMETLSPIKSSLEQAEKSLEMFRPLYREGRQSILEVLRAEEGLARARSAYLDTLYHIHAGYARLRLAAGSLEDEDIRTIQNHLGANP